MSGRLSGLRNWLLGAALLLPLAFGAVAEAQNGVAVSPQAGDMEHPTTCQYRPLRHETIDGVDVTVIERVVAPPDAANHRVVVWIDDGEHRIWKIELHDGRGRLMYTVRYLRYERRGDEWIPTAIYVLDQTHHEIRVVRELHEVAGVDLDQVHAAAAGCASVG